MKKLLIVIAMGFLGLSAQADTQSPAWLCSMNFNGRAVGARLIVGTYRFDGRGTLSCVNPTGQEQQIPVIVRMRAKPISLGASFGVMELSGRTAQIALNADNSRGPKTLLGDYIVGQAQAAIYGGAGVITAVHAKNSSISLQVALQLIKGFGINLGFNRMTVSLDRSRLQE